MVADIDHGTNLATVVEYETKQRVKNSVVKLINWHFLHQQI